MIKSNDLRRFVCGRANQLDQGVLDAAAERIDPVLFGRKGRLHLLCSRELDPAVVGAVYQHYYADTCFDTVPSLSSALAAAYDAHEHAYVHLAVALVIQGLEVTIVGTEQAVVWLAQFDAVKEILIPSRRRENLNRLVTDRGFGYGRWTLFSTGWRLSLGDTLLMTAHPVSQAPDTGRLEHIVAKRASVDGMARAVARVMRKAAPKSLPAPVGVIRVFGFSPVPEMGDRGQTIEPQSVAESPRRYVGRSPIWTALVFAIIAVALTFWLKKPTWSRESISQFLRWVLKPAPTITLVPTETDVVGVEASPQVLPTQSVPTYQPTATLVGAQPTAAPSEPTATPTLMSTAEPYSVPKLSSPKQGDLVHGLALTLRWDWPGTLREGEYFDVRLWRLGTSKRSIAWTRQREYTERHPSSGWYSWTVVIVRGENGVVGQELTEEAGIVRFRWNPALIQPSVEITQEPTPTVAPTRVSPGNRPTRETQ